MGTLTQPSLVVGHRLSHMSIEQLPAELHRHLLLSLEFPELKALVHASPVLHRQYVADRRFVLVSLLHSILDVVVIDACAVQRAMELSFSTHRNNKSVSAFLDIYRQQVLQDKHDVFTTSLHEESVAALVKFHYTMVKPVVDACAENSRVELRLLLEERGEDPSEEDFSSSLSSMETVRFYRAFYRFELACLLFGPGPYLPRAPPGLLFGMEDISERFLQIYQPWEVEEIGSACEYVADLLEEQFKTVWSDDESVSDCSDSDYDAEDQLREMVQGQVMRGLPRILQTIAPKRKTSIGQQSGVMDMNEYDAQVAQRTRRPFLKEAWSPCAQVSRRQKQRQLTERDQKEQDREVMTFLDENDLDPSMPPYAWHIVWDDTYSNCFGSLLCPELRRWCYVMWDADRIEDRGLEDSLRCHRECRDGDPRDFIQHVLHHHEEESL